MFLNFLTMERREEQDLGYDITKERIRATARTLPIWSHDSLPGTQDQQVGARSICLLCKMI